MIRCSRCHRRVNLVGACEEHGLSTRPPAPALPPAPPAELPGWTQGACFALGGSAHLFTAARDGQRAVVKWGRWRDAALHRRFEREARYLRRIGAPLVPALHAQGVVNGWPYLVLEQLDGATLATQLAGRATHPTRDAAAIARAMAALHDAGVSHGDLKPENVFLTPTGVRLIDLGLAHAGDDDAIEPGGTVHYTAPEQLKGRAPTPASDVYALGAMLFELLTGRPPFVGERPAIEYGHVMCRPPRAGDVAPAAAALDELITACLDKRPERRPSLAAVIAALGDAPIASAPAAIAPVAAEPASREHGPVALLWIEARDRAEAARAIADNQGRVLRERADGTLAAFLWLDHDRPARVALAVGKRLALHGAIVLHTAIARVRRSSARVTLHGPAIERPETWRPATPWSGLLVTGDAAADLDHEDLLATDPPGFLRAPLDDQPARSQVATIPDLVARSELIGDLCRELTAALAGEPLLVTLTGGGGAGKSRALDELQRILARDHRVVRVGGRIGHAGRATAGPDLAAALDERSPDAVAERLRAAADRGVVVLVDDGHRVEDELLDLLELAAGWHGARLAVVVATSPALLDARPRWGERARAHHRVALRPLDDHAARRLVRQALAPARLIPEALVARIVEPAHGNPGALVAACRALHRRGLVRRYPGSDEWHVATDEVDLAALASGDRWSAARELAELPAGMRELVTLCAALGDGFDLAELEAVQLALPRGPVAVDAEAGLAWLRKQGLARTAGAAWSLADPALHDAALAHADDAQRAALHRAAFAHWSARTDDGDERLARLAHHGRVAAPAAAAAALLELTRRAARRHAHVEAERTATLALELVDDDAARLRLLVERGRARFRIQRFEAGREDLAAAVTLAAARDDRAGEVEALVADAAILDFTNRLSDAAATIERAAARAATAAIPAEVQARLDNWLGVTRVRQHRFDEAVALLTRAIATAGARGDHETAVGSMLMLASAHRSCGRLPLTLAVLGDAIARCEAERDAFHLTIALLNRINAWREAARFDAADADCGRALALAEVHGFGMMEVFGWFNRSELRFLEGALDRALDDGRRAYAIARRRFRDEPPVFATLWLGVLEAGCGDRERARALHAEASPRHAEQNPMSKRMRAALGLALGLASDATWGELRAATTDPFDRRLYDWLSGSSTPASASAETR